jgi:hypothetical protein
VRPEALRQLLQDLQQDATFAVHLQVAPRQGLAQVPYLTRADRDFLLESIEVHGSLGVALSALGSWAASRDLGYVLVLGNTTVHVGPLPLTGALSRSKLA